MDNHIIRVENLRRDFQVGGETVHALRGVTFSVAKGEFVTIMGTSGSGKSTLLNILGCLDTPTSGEYWLDGVSVREMGRNDRATLRNRKIGFVFQSYNLLPNLNAIENVAMPLMFRGVPKRKREMIARAMLKRVGLGKRMNHYPAQMSGGQQQRVGIARAFVARPQVVFADEPTGNLDSKTKTEVMDMICSFARDSNQTIVLVTHDDNMAQYADRIVTLLDGRIIGDRLT